jgi:hypothetical protein
MIETVYLPTAYLAPISYYWAMMKYPAMLETNEHYIKQTYRNRCVIASANGIMPLSIPVVGKNDQCIRDVRISDHGNWRHLHWHAIMSAYSSSPFFEYYEDDFAPFYEKKFDYLVDFNNQLQELICNLIDFKPVIENTKEYIHELEGNALDLRKKNAFKDIAKSFKPYWQVFEDKYGFKSDLSIIDLLFNLGPESLLYLRFPESFDYAPDKAQ